MTFNEIHKTCGKLAGKKKVREMERKKHREGWEKEGQGKKKKAAPPATKLTASRLDIWPFVIREVPDSVPINLSSESLFSVVLTPQCLTSLSPPVFLFF